MNGSSLHEGVRDQIQQRIASGTYIEGGSIPSAALLSEEFGVSAITVKRALRDLQTSGILTAVAGKGTFVKQQRRFLRDLDIGMSSIEDAQRHGLTLTMRLISITRERIAEPSLLALADSSGVKFCVRKIILADEVPIMYDCTYLSTQLAGAIVEDCGRHLVNDALQNHGIDLKETRLTIDAAPASAQAQAALSLPSGYPMLRRIYNQKTSRPDIRVMGLVESPFDRLACSVTLSTDKRIASGASV